MRSAISTSRQFRGAPIVIDPLETRRVLAAAAGPVVVDFIEVHVETVTGEFARELQPGVYTKEDLGDIDLSQLSFAGLDEVMELKPEDFDGFNHLPPRAEIESTINEIKGLLPGLSVTFSRYTDTEMRASIRVQADEIDLNASLGLSIVNLRRMNVDVDVSPGMGSIGGYVYYTGPIGEPAEVMPGDGQAGFYKGTLYVNGTGSADDIGLSVKGSKLRVNINGTISSFNLSQVTKLSVSGASGNDRIDLGGGVPGAAIYGKNGDDRIYGSAFNDVIDAGAGKDRVWGRAGDDRIAGTTNPDRLYGGDGRDTVDGGSGNDQIFGEGGKDRLIGGSGDDWIEGGASADRISDSGGEDSLLGCGGRDVILAVDGAHDHIYGGGDLDMCEHDGLDEIVGVETH